MTNIRLDVPFPYFKDNDMQRKWCQAFETKNISINKNTLLEPKDVGQGMDWELIFRVKIFGSRIYLGRENTDFDLGLGEVLTHQSNLVMIGKKEEILSIYKEKKSAWLWWYAKI